MKLTADIEHMIAMSFLIFNSFEFRVRNSIICPRESYNLLESSQPLVQNHGICKGLPIKFDRLIKYRHWVNIRFCMCVCMCRLAAFVLNCQRSFAIWQNDWFQFLSRLCYVLEKVTWAFFFDLICSHTHTHHNWRYTITFHDIISVYLYLVFFLYSGLAPPLHHVVESITYIKVQIERKVTKVSYFFIALERWHLVYGRYHRSLDENYTIRVWAP